MITMSLGLWTHEIHTKLAKRSCWVGPPSLFLRVPGIDTRTTSRYPLFAYYVYIFCTVHFHSNFKRIFKHGVRTKSSIVICGFQHRFRGRGRTILLLNTVMILFYLLQDILTTEMCPIIAEMSCTIVSNVKPTIEILIIDLWNVYWDEFTRSITGDMKINQFCCVHFTISRTIWVSNFQPKLSCKLGT
jgi:hypothetical protein